MRPLGPSLCPDALSLALLAATLLPRNLLLPLLPAAAAPPASSLSWSFLRLRLGEPSASDRDGGLDLSFSCWLRLEAALAFLADGRGGAGPLCRRAAGLL